MSGSTTETSIEELARVLTTQRDQGQRAILFLGARAGGLFSNQFLYDTLKNFSLLNFDTLSNVDKFRECYYVLNKQFTENERHNILVGALATLRYREEDRLLAEIIKAGLFEVIISTNIDTLLEDACSSCGLWEPDDYRVFIPGVDETTEFEKSKLRSSIIKVFGDLESRHYSMAGKAFDLQAEHGLLKFLASILTRNVLIVGYDPVWDNAIEPAFPTTGGAVWYVNETALSKNAFLASALDQRGSKFLQGDQGTYSSFLRVLYDFLGEGVSREEIATMSFPLMPQSPGQARKRVFISYSHKDQEYLERLMVHLMGYLRAGSEKDILDIWDDRKISSGTGWKKKLKKALTQAKVAVLLVSADFLSSDSKHELPILLKAADRGDVKLLPIILESSASSFNDREPLYEYQVVNSVLEPLKRMSLYEQEVLWAKLAEQIFDILSSQK